MYRTTVLTTALTLLLLALASGASASTQCPLEDRFAGIDTGRTERQADACVYFVRVDDDFYASRSFRLLVPDSHYDSELAPAPRMVVDFHGTGSNKANQLRSSCWKDKAIDAGIVVAYPNGTGIPSSFSAGDYCCNTKIGPPMDDVAFTRLVVQTAQTIVGAGDWRVYASGLSNGGAMAHELACEATDLIDGIAAVSQTFTKKPGSVCLSEGERAIPVIDFRATRDRVIPYEGGKSLATLFTRRWLSAEESRLRWEAELMCTGEPTRVDANGAGTSYCLHMECETPFAQCTIEGDHVPYADARDEGLEICETAWTFFGEQAAE